jgi:hypothetical protein
MFLLPCYKNVDIQFSEDAYAGITVIRSKDWKANNWEQINPKGLNGITKMSCERRGSLLH